MKNLCTIKSICRLISEYEVNFHRKYGISLNEGLLLCSLRNGSMSSGEIAEELELSCSNTSKVLRSVEEKGFVERVLGEKDRRQMYFNLTKTGLEIIGQIESDELDIPDMLKQIDG